MTKRRMLTLGIAGLAMFACASVAIAYVLRDPVNASGCAKIHEGMTEAEVVRILGRPSDESRLSNHYRPETDGNGRTAYQIHMTTSKIWHASSCTITVDFSEAGRVEFVQWYNRDTVLRMLRRLLWLEENTPVPILAPMPTMSPTARPDLPEEDTVQPEEDPNR